MEKNLKKPLLAKINVFRNIILVLKHLSSNPSSPCFPRLGWLERNFKVDGQNLLHVAIEDFKMCIAVKLKSLVVKELVEASCYVLYHGLFL